MKKLLPISATALLLGAALVLPALAQPYGQNAPNNRGQNADQRDERRDARQDARDDRRDDRRADAQRAWQRRENWRDDRRDARWDAAQHNGYLRDNRWHYGPPPSQYQGRSNIVLGYQPWQRGQRLGYYQSRYTPVDYRTLQRRRPIRGYQWVRDTRGDALLVSISTGVIADIIVNANYR